MRRALCTAMGGAAAAVLAVTAPGSVLHPAAQQPGECLVVDDFSGATVGQFPSQWRARTEAGRAVYAIGQEGPLRFLRAISRGTGIQAARGYEWDLTTYPVLSWSWRVRQFPSGADEREGRSNDSAVAVYLLVPYSRFLGPKAVKYVWSERVAAGSRLSSNGGLTQVRVLRSGPDPMGAWVEERVNARDDYLAYFGVTAVPRPAGIAVLTDADDTGSSAEGDYTGFRVCRE